MLRTGLNQHLYKGGTEAERLNDIPRISGKPAREERLGPGSSTPQVCTLAWHHLSWQGLELGSRPSAPSSSVMWGQYEALTGKKMEIYLCRKSLETSKNTSVQEASKFLCKKKKKGAEQGADNVQRRAECKGTVVQNQDSGVCEQQM